ncbi:hypothetical protein MMC17_004194 [Xylographa soralifera]|nr:hypothetical protein [Xylographa soralifera]
MNEIGKEETGSRQIEDPKAEDQNQADPAQPNETNSIRFSVQNPLHGLEPQELMNKVQNFAALTNWRPRDLELLKLGSIIAQNPAAIKDMPGAIAAGAEAFGNLRSLDDDELKYLKDEDENMWRQPRPLYFTIVLCSIGAAVQGWDQVGINAANLRFPTDLNVPLTSGIAGADLTPNGWVIGLINAAPYISSALLGCWLSDPLNHYFGRRGTTFIAAIICMVTVLGSAFVRTWWELLACRLLLGIGMGVKASTVPVFAAENSPSQIRGALVMGWQMWVAFGIFLGFSANLAVVAAGDTTWRLQLGSAMIPAIPLVMMIYLCPESPRWYMKKGQHQKAYQSLCRLRNCNLQAARDAFYIFAQLEQNPNKLSDETTFLIRFWELFTKERVRQATLASWTVMIAQQMCGINIITFYSSTIFTEAGASYISALWASWGFGLVNFIFAFPALFTIDHYGRRTLLLFTFPQMAWTLLGAGFCFHIPGEQGAHLGMIAFFVYAFAAFYSPGEGPVPFTYSAEVFPLSHRGYTSLINSFVEVGMGFAVATNLLWAAVLSLTFPSMRSAMGDTGAFGFYANLRSDGATFVTSGLNMIAFIMIFFFVRETRKKTLEDLDGVFKIPLLQFASHQVKKTLPYWWKRYVRLERGVRVEPLYEEIDLPSA